MIPPLPPRAIPQPVIRERDEDEVLGHLRRLTVQLATAELERQATAPQMMAYLKTIAEAVGSPAGLRTSGHAWRAFVVAFFLTLLAGALGGLLARETANSPRPSASESPR